MFRSTAFRVALIVVFAIFLGYYDLPNPYQVIPGTPESFGDAKVHLGLDLQGGSQLDYKIDLRKVPEADRADIVEGVKNVINKRVNSLGVSEPNIYTSAIGNEQHLIVELAGVKDLNEAKKVVGKTIQLEFKEKREKADPAHKENMRKLANSVLGKVRGTPANFALIGQEEAQASPDKVQLNEEDFTFLSDINDTKISQALKNTASGKVFQSAVEASDGYTIQNGEYVPKDGFFLLKVLEKRSTADAAIEEKNLKVSHILIAYRGADRAADTVTRSKEEAEQLAKDTLAKLKTGGGFEKTAKELSDEPGAKESAGKLPDAVTLDGSYVSAFSINALQLKTKGELSDVVSTPFGFHIIRGDEFEQVKYEQIYFSSSPDPWQETGLTGEHFEHADVRFDSFLRPIVAIRFNSDGAKLFEKITERNVGKPVAIFVGGNLISSPNVNEKIAGGEAIITGNYSVEEAQGLARDLNTGAIPAPVILSGQYTIGATLGQEALDKSLRAGILGIFIVAIFMIFFYRLPGAIAVVALGIYTTILLFLIKSELPLAISLTVAIFIFIAIIYQLLRSKDDGWEKFISFVLGCFVLFFVTFLLTNAIVLTLAGVAGVILSIGMAVDANILIFERMKEELRAGRPLSAAVDVGFDRAWNSIRDSNFSSLITCGILFYFGTSIIQGFAFNLAAGILISMFTAITVTRTLLRAVLHTRLGEKLSLWGASAEAADGPKKQYHIIEKSRTWFTISGSVIGVSLLALIFFGLKLGIDFKGGSFLDLTFAKPVTVEELKGALTDIQTTINAGQSGQKITSGTTENLESAAQALDLASARIIPAGENQLLLHLEHIDNETHDKILVALESKFGEVTENRFTTIGPVVGETLKKRAILAVMIAMLMIILYIAFAFRKVPRRVSPWKFGICAIVALLHDVLIPVGVFAVLRLEVDALFITAILTVLGFSVHDTIVVFDRIRENLKYQSRDESFAHLANKSMSETMTRSINTSLTVLITLLALLLLGSASIFNFILVLVIGISVGTYSSIFIASPLLVLWQKRDERA